MPAINDSKYLVTMDWDDVPHLAPDEKKKILESTPLHLRDARAKGRPSLGAGAIFPIPESEIVVPPFEIPDYWPRIAGLDVGWKRTAAVWLAHDRQGGQVFMYAEHYRSAQEPSIQVASLKARGDWITFPTDPGARGRSQIDGRRLFDEYFQLGLNVIMADNAVEAGLAKMWEMFSGGRLKIFESCRNFLSEYRIYRRDNSGRIVKSNDHAIDACRYGLSRIEHARTKPKKWKNSNARNLGSGSSYTGY